MDDAISEQGLEGVRRTVEHGVHTIMGSVNLTDGRDFELGDDGSEAFMWCAFGRGPDRGYARPGLVLKSAGVESVMSDAGSTLPQPVGPFSLIATNDLESSVVTMLGGQVDVGFREAEIPLVPDAATVTVDSVALHGLMRQSPDDYLVRAWELHIPEET